MKEAELLPRLKELYMPPAGEIVLVDVPDLRFMMIDGRGAADRTALDHAVKWLFAVAFPIRRIARERMGRNFVEPPIEGLWWADDPEDFLRGRRDSLNWRMMIIFEPEWLTSEMFGDAVTAGKARLGEPPSSLRLESYAEGLSAQTMYIGPPESEGPTIARLHEEFLPAHGLTANGRHHEIYLTNPNRVAPERMKTVLRQPVCRRG
jgi:hypothetical protein